MRSEETGSKHFQRQRLVSNTLYEDSDIIVADKPAGVVTYDFAATFEGKIDPALIDQFPERGGLVHRLDKDTSGLLILAKNEASLHALQQQFKDRKVVKVYTALVHGPLLKKMIIKLPIARTGAGTMGISGTNPRDAETEITPLKEIQLSDGSPAMWIEARPKTGRMHQIRVHLKAAGHPVVGDTLYGMKKRDAALSISKMYLFATGISFIHPRSGMKMNFELEYSDKV